MGEELKMFTFDFQGNLKLAQKEIQIQPKKDSYMTRMAKQHKASEPLNEEKEKKVIEHFKQQRMLN